MPTTSEQLKAKDIQTILHPLSSIGMTKHQGPHVLSEGQGIYITDSDGKRFISCDAGLGATTLGFGRKDLGEVMLKAAGQLGFYQTTLGSTHEAQIHLAEKLLSLMPSNISKIFFANSGSDANESALKIARMFHLAQGHKHKTRIIAQRLSYHGSTNATTQLTNIPGFQEDFGIHQGDTLIVDCPAYFMNDNKEESEAAFTDRLIQQLENTIEKEGADTIAAFIVEPIMGCAGAVVPPKDYLQRVAAVLSAHGILLIGDEVLCGYGRTGKMFGLEHFNIAPDIITSAKGLTSGYFPMSAVGVSEEIMHVIEQTHNGMGNFFHGFTTCGHPIGAAVALKTLSLMEELNIVENSRARGAQLKQALTASFGDNPFIQNIRGEGLLMGVQIKAKTQPDIADYSDEKLMALTEHACRHVGLLVRAANPSSSLYIVPPLITTEAEIQLISELFTEGFQLALNAL